MKHSRPACTLALLLVALALTSCQSSPANPQFRKGWSVETFGASSAAWPSPTKKEAAHSAPDAL